jgi:diguanylate cyclase (GGDEF)-like protein
VARYGGEEFALIAPAADETNALAMARAICNALQELQHAHPSSPFGVVTASIGVAVMVPGNGDTRQTLIERADRALYRAKERGRNQVILAG